MAKISRKMQSVIDREAISSSLLDMTSLLVHRRREDEIFSGLVKGGSLQDGGSILQIPSLAEIIHVKNARAWYCDSSIPSSDRRTSREQEGINFELLAANSTLPKGMSAKSRILEDFVRSSTTGSVKILNGRIKDATGDGKYTRPTGAIFLHFKYQRGDIVITLSDPHQRAKPFSEQGEGRYLTTFRRTLEGYLSGVYDARIDLLTGLLNKRAYESEFSERLSTTSLGYGAIIMIDIDHFKKYNDLLGHANGDIALRQTGENVKKSIRKYDIAGRYGGEEMIVMLPDVKGIHELAMVCERIRQSVESDSYHGKDQVGQVTISVGGILFPHGRESVITPLVERADTGLYIVKGERFAQIETDSGSNDYIPIPSTEQRNRCVVSDLDSRCYYFVTPTPINQIPLLRKLKL